MLQSSLSDGVAFDPFSLQKDGRCSAEVDVGRCQVLQAFMVTPVIVVLDEARESLRLPLFYNTHHPIKSARAKAGRWGNFA